MKNIIFCFTGTGNSLAAATDISDILHDTKIVPMKKDSQELLKEKYQRIGFIFPVYFGGVPGWVSEFLAALKLVENKDTYFFAIATNAMIPGNSIRTVNRILKQKGTSLNYGNTVKMGENYIVMTDPGKSSVSWKKDYKKNIDDIAEDILADKTSPDKKEVSIVYKYNQFQLSRCTSMDRHFRISGQCTNCGICTRLCPAENIEPNESGPIFRHRCQQCMACISHCPRHAIEYKNKTEKRTRYQNPAVPTKDLIHFQQQLPE